MSDMPREERPAEAGPAPRFEELAALGRNAWWRYVVALLVFVILSFVGINALVLLFAVALSAAGTGMSAASVLAMIQHADDWTAAGDAEALAAFVGFMIVFMPPLLAAFVTVRLVHQRPWRTLLTARPRFDWPAALFSLVVTWGLLALTLLPGLLIAPEDFLLTFDAGRFLLFLPFILALVPLQVLAEEVLFRGYLLQAARRLTANRVALVAVPAALFVVPHLWNQEAAVGGLWAILDYIVIGLYLTWLALRGNGLEYAFGFHLGINLFLFLVMGSTAASVPTPAVLSNQAPDFALGVLATVVACLAHHWIIFRRRSRASGDPYPVVMRAGR